MVNKEERTMLTLSILVFTVVLLASVISIGIRLAWGATKFIFGLGLFWFCPLLFVLAVLFGGFSHTWLLIVIVGLLFGSGFRRIWERAKRRGTGAFAIPPTLSRKSCSLRDENVLQLCLYTESFSARIATRTIHTVLPFFCGRYFSKNIILYRNPTQMNLKTKRNI